jgi:hypothetical protein
MSLKLAFFNTQHKFKNKTVSSGMNDERKVIELKNSRMVKIWNKKAKLN